MRQLMVVACVVACSARSEPRPQPAPVTATPPAPERRTGEPQRVIEETKIDEDTAEQIDHVLCPSHFDNACHHDRGVKNYPKRWMTGAAGLEIKRPTGTRYVLAKKSLVGTRWFGEVWVSDEIDNLVDDREGTQRPASPVLVVDTEIEKDDRLWEPVVGLEELDDGRVLFVAGSVLDQSQMIDTRRFAGNYLEWRGDRLVLTRIVKITTEHVDGKTTRDAGWRER